MYDDCCSPFPWVSSMEQQPTNKKANVVPDSTGTSVCGRVGGLHSIILHSFRGYIFYTIYMKYMSDEEKFIRDMYPELVRDMSTEANGISWKGIADLLRIYKDINSKSQVSLGGFNIKLQKHRLGATVGTITVLLHPDDYDRVVPTDEKLND